MYKEAIVKEVSDKKLVKYVVMILLLKFHGRIMD